MLFSKQTVGQHGDPIPGAFCSHCENSGMVLLDRWNPQKRKQGDTEWVVYEEAAAPCPACSRGMIRNHQTHPEPSKQFWAVVDAHQVTWNGGWTLQHRWCSKCEAMRSGVHECHPPPTTAMPEAPTVGSMPNLT